jgi:signal transduction histidine kinase
MFDLPMRDTWLILATAITGALLVGLPGAFGLRLLRSRSITVHIAALLTVTVAAAFAGVFGIAQAMFISVHDRNVLFVVLTGSGAVSLLIGWWLGRRLAADAVWADQMREQERQAEARRRELVAWVSHDLRTPLAGMRAMAEALEDGVVADPITSREYFYRIRAEADRMAALVDDLFEMARINAGALRLSLSRLPPGSPLPSRRTDPVRRTTNRDEAVVATCSRPGKGVPDQQLTVVRDVRLARWPIDQLPSGIHCGSRPR